MSDTVSPWQRKRTIYDQIAPHYDKAVAPLDRWFLAQLRATAFGYLPEGARVLELGAGTGLNFATYPANAAGVATEPSSGMLQIARQKIRPTGVRLVQSYAEHLPFKNDSFDAALATLVFCSLTHPTKAFAELRRVVKSGGTVILLEHVRPRGLLGPVFDLVNLITVPLFDDHFNRRTAEVAQASGLEFMTVESSLLGIMNLIACRV
ncbi:MAG TPA: methyltransferase domain-containing protein [Pyrinomonadaceae bacterium]